MNYKKQTGVVGYSFPATPINHKLIGFGGKGTIKNLKFKILTLLLSGKFSAAELNHASGSNDSRKLVSLLRREGHQILDYKRDDRHKTYYTRQSLNSDDFNVDDANFGKIGGIQPINTTGHE